MEERHDKLRGNAMSDEELEGVVGGAQAVEIERCAGCGRSCAPAAMYARGGKKYCPACYRKALRG